MRPATMEEMEDTFHAFCSGNRTLHLKMGEQEVEGEILEVLLYSGSLLARVQDKIIEIELQEEETIH